jgi:predicted RNA-binding protein with PIN domain
MIHYIIDGNNLIGKIPRLKELHLKNKQLSRSELVAILNSYFAGKKINLTLHLDGYKNLPLSLSKGKIVYSDSQTSDAKIRDEISRFKNPKLITLVSSDRSLTDFARVNSSTVIKSEEFYGLLNRSNDKNEEIRAVKNLESEKDYFKKIFGTNNP